MLHSAELPEPGLATRVSCLTLMELNIGQATAETAGYWLLSNMSSHLQLTKRSRKVAHISIAPARFLAHHWMQVHRTLGPVQM